MGYWGEKREYEEELEEKSRKERYCNFCGEEFAGIKTAKCKDCEEIVCKKCYSLCKRCKKAVCDSCSNAAQDNGVKPNMCSDCGEGECYYCNNTAETNCKECGNPMCRKHIKKQEEHIGYFGSFFGSKGHSNYCKNCV